MSKDDKPLIWLAGEVRTPPFSAEARLGADTCIDSYKPA